MVYNFALVFTSNKPQYGEKTMVMWIRSHITIFRGFNLKYQSSAYATPWHIINFSPVAVLLIHPIRLRPGTYHITSYHIECGIFVIAHSHHSSSSTAASPCGRNNHFLGRRWIGLMKVFKWFAYRQRPTTCRKTCECEIHHKTMFQFPRRMDFWIFMINISLNSFHPHRGVTIWYEPPPSWESRFSFNCTRSLA